MLSAKLLLPSLSGSADLPTTSKSRRIPEVCFSVAASIWEAIVFNHNLVRVPLTQDLAYGVYAK